MGRRKSGHPFDRFDEEKYFEHQVLVGFVILGGIAAWQARNQLAKIGLTRFSVLGWTAGGYLAIQVVGTSIGYLLDGEEGVRSWQRASNTIFENRTWLDEVPVVGEFVSMLPNPLGIYEVIEESVTLAAPHVYSFWAYVFGLDWYSGSNLEKHVKQVHNLPGKFVNITPGF